MSVALAAIYTVDMRLFSGKIINPNLSETVQVVQVLILRPVNMFMTYITNWCIIFHKMEKALHGNLTKQKE